MAKSDFKVSVIIPVYNAEKFVQKAVESALQLNETGEILLIEDGSPDNALAVCKRLEKEYDNVRLLQHPDKKNHGASASRNLGIISSKFDYIAFLDADDYYLPNRFIKDKEILQNEPQIDGVYNALGIHYYTEKGRDQFINAGYQYQEFYTVTDAVSPDELFLVLFNQHPIVKGEFHGNCVTLRKRVFELTGLFKTDINIIEDTHLWRRVAAVCKLKPGFIKEAVAIRGVHDDNRMIDSIERSKYYDLWWKDLYTWLNSHKINRYHFDSFCLAYLNYKILNHSKLKVLPSFLSFFLSHPKLITQKYGQFDIYFFNLFGRGWLSRHLIGIKNRIIKNKNNIYD